MGPAGSVGGHSRRRGDRGAGTNDACWELGILALMNSTEVIGKAGVHSILVH